MIVGTHSVPSTWVSSCLQAAGSEAALYRLPSAHCAARVRPEQGLQGLRGAPLNSFSQEHCPSHLKTRCPDARTAAIAKRILSMVSFASLLAVRVFQKHFCAACVAVTSVIPFALMGSISESARVRVHVNFWRLVCRECERPYAQERYPELCTPEGGYVAMVDDRFDAQLRQQHAASNATWGQRDGRKKTARPCREPRTPS